VRIHVVSDLHDDIDGNRIGEWPSVDADVVVVAGDAMAPGSHALRLVRRLYPDTSIPTLYVPGNHDFYSEGSPKRLRHDPSLKTTWETERVRMREVADELGIILLDDATAEIDGVRFVGSTLWTDFAARPHYMSFTEAAREAEHRMNDYKLIKTGAGRSRDKLTARDTVTAHRASRRFIEETLATPFDGETTVVVTHMAPSFRSLYGWDPERPQTFGSLDWCYASDLESMMHGDNAPALWIHGHLHQSRDYCVGDTRVGDTRVVANPRGYPAEPGSKLRENPHFDQQLVVEIEPRYVPTMGVR
jgi:Icc-related predicted phosphoesterase